MPTSSGERPASSRSSSSAPMAGSSASLPPSQHGNDQAHGAVHRRSVRPRFPARAQRPERLRRLIQPCLAGVPSRAVRSAAELTRNGDRGQGHGTARVSGSLTGCFGTSGNR